MRFGKREKDIKDYSIKDVKRLDEIYENRGLMRHFLICELDRDGVEREFYQSELDRMANGKYDDEWRGGQMMVEGIAMRILNRWESRPGSAWE